MVPTIVIFVRTVRNSSDAKRAVSGPCRSVGRRSKFTCDVRTPNITGYTGAAWDDMSGNVTGAFYFSGDATESANGLRGRFGISFDASRVTSAYGRSSTVQPASTRLLYCIKS